MLPPDPLPPSHPTRPLIAWAMLLLPLRNQKYFNNVHARLSQLVPQPDAVDLDAVKTLLSPGCDILDIPTIVLGIVRHCYLAEWDRDFDWDHLVLPAPDVPITAADLPWQLREQVRLITGCYTPVPWAKELPPIEGHYAHLSSEKPGLVAYTQDPAKGIADKQTQIRPGRYLTRFYPDLSAADVRRIVGDVPRPATLAFARTADEIEKIYIDGPTSCMTQPASAYESPCHPVRVYGDSDLSLAYAVPPSGSPTARALVWSEKKRFGRVYGDEPLLERLLDDAGYQKGSLSGARIRRIPLEANDDFRVVMPYLDHVRSFDELDDDWLSLGGPYAATSTNGVASLEERSQCDSCSEYVDELYDVGGDQWCEDCRENDAFCSDYSEEHFPSGHACEVVVRREGDECITAYWTNDERDQFATYCDATHDHYQTDRFEFIERDNGETWVSWYLDEHPDTDDDTPSTADGSADNDNEAVGERAAA